MLLLDDCFDSVSSYESICAPGFKAERFTTHFPDRNNPEKRQKKIKDPDVINFCQKRGYLLLTTDHEMKKTFIEELKMSDIGVLSTANNQDGPSVWIEALKKSKSRILRDFKKAQRPYFSIIQKTGQINTQTLTPQMKTRRSRPKERAESNELAEPERRDKRPSRDSPTQR
ncbi:MAG: hypothetical protein ACKV2U_16420 [Bryobacteraceae bacterium]